MRLPLPRALEMISTREIEDAKTIIGLLLAAPRLGVRVGDVAETTVAEDF